MPVASCWRLKLHRKALSTKPSRAWMAWLTLRGMSCVVALRDIVDETTSPVTFVVKHLDDVAIPAVNGTVGVLKSIQKNA